MQNQILKLQHHRKHGHFSEKIYFFPTSFSATYLKQVMGGKELLELDYMANTFRVNGEDMLETYRQNIGG
ncbi:phage major tail tube protein [Janthinobacterium sp. B9-8]|uniref:phage major tail tube protein n=1 Tax=Janthinobacterium sp. B9-8 TaxID=1236179 RepID=UPI00061D364F|nr:phage major tail tube protein [Janthinobacterium sp. B9-8]AMC34664.1 hypothetical protein VN23_08605 [Janthinobacterium sp. B9-8]